MSQSILVGKLEEELYTACERKDWSARTPHSTAFQSHHFSRVKQTFDLINPWVEMLLKVFWGYRVLRRLNIFCYSQKAIAKFTWKLLLKQNPQCRNCCFSRKRKTLVHMSLSPACMLKKRESTFPPLYLIGLFVPSQANRRARSRPVVKAFWELGERSQNKLPFPQCRKAAVNTALTCGCNVLLVRWD